jgi:hypothetical protein
MQVGEVYSILHDTMDSGTAWTHSDLVFGRLWALVIGCIAMVVPGVSIVRVVYNASSCIILKVENGCEVGKHIGRL